MDIYRNLEHFLGVIKSAAYRMSYLEAVRGDDINQVMRLIRCIRGKNVIGEDVV